MTTTCTLVTGTDADTCDAPAVLTFHADSVLEYHLCEAHATDEDYTLPEATPANPDTWTRQVEEAVATFRAQVDRAVDAGLVTPTQARDLNAYADDVDLADNVDRQVGALHVAQDALYALI